MDVAVVPWHEVSTISKGLYTRDIIEIGKLGSFDRSKND